jgi:TonB family protein
VLVVRGSLLTVYEHEVELEIGREEKLFRVMILSSLLLFGGIGLFLRMHNPPPLLLEEKMIRARQVSFIVEENKKPGMTMVQPRPVQPKPAPVEEKKPEPLPEKPIDLTNKPLLDQKVDDNRPDNSNAVNKEPVRRVYGLRKVYSSGIGADGSAVDAVVGKLGNTLATDIDTFIATEKELKGTLAPVTTVRSMPRYRKQVKPEYTNAMIENGIQGIINVKILIDIDGKVKKVQVLDDLGYGSKQKVYEACWRLEFEPARMQDGRPVAVWLTVPFRFEITQ